MPSVLGGAPGLELAVRLGCWAWLGEGLREGPEQAHLDSPQRFFLI